MDLAALLWLVSVQTYLPPLTRLFQGHFLIAAGLSLVPLTSSLDSKRRPHTGAIETLKVAPL